VDLGCVRSLVDQTLDYAKTSGKNGVSAFGDMGSFFHQNKENNNLIEHELSLPSEYEDGMNLKTFCTPERGQSGYTEAIDFVQSVCGVGTTALVDEDDGQKEGSFDRAIGLVYCGNDNINNKKSPVYVSSVAFPR
jgi:hypothetical protein